MFRRAPIVFTVLTLTACGGDGFPRDGLWEATNPTVESTTCNDLSPEDLEAPEYTGFNMLREIDGTFTIVLIDGTDAPEEFDECELVLEEMTCSGAVRDTVPFGPTVLNTRLRLSGEFQTRSGTLRQTLTANCEGTGCAVAENKLDGELPCDIVVAYEADWDSDELGPLGESTPAGIN